MNNKFVSTLRESFELFVNNPEFIVPKLIIAILYSINLILTADLLEKVLLGQSSYSLSLLATSLFLLIFALVINIIDIVISAMYPFMVAQLQSGKKLNFFDALADVKKRFGKIVLSVAEEKYSFMLLIG